jgi:hypothetical protein
MRVFSNLFGGLAAKVSYLFGLRSAVHVMKVLRGSSFAAALTRSWPNCTSHFIRRPERRSVFVVRLQ